MGKVPESSKWNKIDHAVNNSFLLYQFFWTCLPNITDKKEVQLYAFKMFGSIPDKSLG